MLEKFAERLRQARREKKWSAIMLSKKSGVSLCAIYSYACGKRYPNLYTAVCLADALGVSLDWLAGRE